MNFQNPAFGQGFVKIEALKISVKIIEVMKYCLVTYGCQMNKSDSERIAAVLEKIGYKKASKPMEADLIVVNMCSVRQSAVDRVFGLAPKFKKLKTKNSKLKTILTGCILKKDRQKFSERFDYILSIKDLPTWPNLLSKNPYKQPTIVSAATQPKSPENQFGHRDYSDEDYFKLQPKYSSLAKALVPISTGCNNFCAYCVVPYVRGKEKYRSQKAIIEEIKLLIKKGVKEITLLGQNVNSYPNFVGLLRKITSLPGNFKIKFITNHPKDFSDELINEVAQNPKIAKCLHLPLQAGDNTVLKKMNRRYTRQDYLKLVSKIKKTIPGVEITTDIIVGFPGETKKQFQKTIDVFKKVRFANAFIAKYSPRPGTAASRLKDNVSLAEKKRREQVLRNLLRCLKSPCKHKIVVVLGPTASGKSELAVKLAKKFNGEIVSADSRQVYKEMDIGTGKISKTKQKNIPHYLLDVVSPKRQFSVAQYQKLAMAAINKILSKGKTPFLVGGSPFYIYSIVDGWIFPKVKVDKKLRKKLEQKSASQLLEMLKKIAPERAKSIEKKNKRRLIRAIEIAKALDEVPKLKKNPQFDCLLLGIKKSKEELEMRISKRVDKMIKSGLEKEVKTLVKKYGRSLPLQTIGYQEWLSCPEKETSKKEVAKTIKTHTLQFAKRQMTWFRRDKRICWAPPTHHPYNWAERLVKEFLSSGRKNRN